MGALLMRSPSVRASLYGKDSLHREVCFKIDLERRTSTWTVREFPIRPGSDNGESRGLAEGSAKICEEGPHCFTIHFLPQSRPNDF